MFLHSECYEASELLSWLTNVLTVVNLMQTIANAIALSSPGGDGGITKGIAYGHGIERIQNRHHTYGLGGLGVGGSHAMGRTSVASSLEQVIGSFKNGGG